MNDKLDVILCENLIMIPTSLLQRAILLVHEGIEGLVERESVVPKNQ